MTTAEFIRSLRKAEDLWFSTTLNLGQYQIWPGSQKMPGTKTVLFTAVLTLIFSHLTSTTNVSECPFSLHFSNKSVLTWWW